MRKLVLSIALLGSAIAATPAIGQDYRGQYGNNDGYNVGNGGSNYSVRLRQIGVRIDRNVRAGNFSNREAYALRREYANLVNLDRRLRQGGLTRWERNTLDQRVTRLAARVRDFRGNGYNQAQVGFNDGQPYGNRDRRFDARDGRDDRYDDDRRFADPRYPQPR